MTASDRLVVRRLDARDLAAYKALRDQTLAAFPDAFTSEAGEERRREASEYLQRFGTDRRDGGHLTLGAFEGSGPDAPLVGAASLERDRRIKVSHLAHLIGMMVRADRQGRGIGSGLLDATLAAARASEGLERLTLTVTDGNDAAVGLYASRGFVVYGRLEDAIRVGPRRLAKLHMTLALRG